MLTFSFFTWHIMDPQQTAMNVTQVHEPCLEQHQLRLSCDMPAANTPGRAKEAKQPNDCGVKSPGLDVRRLMIQTSSFTNSNSPVLQFSPGQLSDQSRGFQHSRPALECSVSMTNDLKIKITEEKNGLHNLPWGSECGEICNQIVTILAWVWFILFSMTHKKLHADINSMILPPK